tara:strand:- start:198 stop:2063 length:1866 start_codon:yes stop_codon:yes gene_type:complete
MANYKPEEIIALVDNHYDLTEPLRTRMDDDHKLYRLEEFDAGEGFQSYTSNEPQVYADKLISWLSSAEMVVRIPYGNSDREQRENNDAKEKFLIGLIKAADDRLINKFQPAVRQQMAWFITLRGWYAARALLVKDEDGDTHVEIQPWDPLHTYWGEGKNGLSWACYKTKRTPTEIEALWGVKLQSEGKGPDDDDGIDVYDFYDSEDNIVCTDDTVLKKRTKHGAKGVPVALGPVGANPLVQAITDTGNLDTVEDYGESCYKSSRDLFEKHNFMMSVMLELTARSRKQGLKVKSRDGNKTLEEDPYVEGSEIALGQGEDVEPLGLLEMAKESGVFMGLVSGEMQRGGLPHSIYGQLEFQLSGFAINTLRQGVETVLVPRLQAMEKAYKSIFQLLCDQYITGAFKSFEVSGQDKNRMYFSEEVTSDVIKNAGDVEVSFIGQLPQDEMGKMSMAQIAREGDNPLLSDSYIRDNILGLQSADKMEDAIKTQVAERTLPEATLWSLLQSANRQGREDLAELYQAELRRLFMSKSMEEMQMVQQFAQAQAPPPPPAAQAPMAPGGMPPQGGVGLPPTVMPNAALGVPPPVPVAPVGPMVAPGTPRPGAQSTENRLTNLGLIPPVGGN